MKSLAIFVILIAFVMLNPVTTFGQQSKNEVIVETVPGSTNSLSVTIIGPLYDNGFTIFSISEYSDSNGWVVVHEDTHTFSQSNPTHVFNFDYPFSPDEYYQVSALNGWKPTYMNWIPNPVTQEEPEKEKPATQQEPQKEKPATEQVTSQASSNVFVEIPAAVTQEETTSQQDPSEDTIQSLIEENEFLRQQIEKKDAIIFEQLKVIVDLAAKVTNVIFYESTGKLYFVADTSEDTIQSLIEENEFLRQQIEKKDAIIMEQLKVIQDLASMVQSAIFEPRLGVFSLV